MATRADKGQLSHQFKIEAVQQVLSGYQQMLTEVARTLGISRFLLWSWTREYREEAARAFPIHTENSRGRVVGRLQEENERLAAENEALKRCLSLISSSAGQGQAGRFRYSAARGETGLVGPDRWRAFSCPSICSPPWSGT